MKCLLVIHVGIGQLLTKRPNKDVPVHIFLFQPFHQLSHLPKQSLAKIMEAKRIARESGIESPYLAGVTGGMHQNTYCPLCGTLLIARTSQEVAEKIIAKGEEVSRFCPTYAQINKRISSPRCPSCSANIPVVL
jgi:pyruvate formate lyase activating enzyme